MVNKVLRKIQKKVNDIEDLLRLTPISVDSAEELCDMFILQVERGVNGKNEVTYLEERKKEERGGGGR